VKIPISVLVVIHTAKGEVLLLERADHPGFWQSVTGSIDFIGESLIETAARELLEETGIDAKIFDENALVSMNHSIEYEIYPEWRHRYPKDITINTEHWFRMTLEDRVPAALTSNTSDNIAACFSGSPSRLSSCKPTLLPSYESAIRILHRSNAACF
jgi:dATP pyrophosphohydrolase